MENATPAADQIEGLFLTALRQIRDQRGTVLHMLPPAAPELLRAGEYYFSEVLPGAVKAWKRHRRQTQNLAVPVGRIRLVVFDDRPSSSTRGRLRELELGRPDAYRRVKIPPEVWYGFGCISAGPALLANCVDLPHDPNECDRRPADDPGIPYRWRTP